jgi:hypothetical protein
MISLFLIVNTRAIHDSQLVFVVIVPEIILKLEVRRANTTTTQTHPEQHLIHY